MDLAWYDYGLLLLAVFLFACAVGLWMTPTRTEHPREAAGYYFGVTLLVGFAGLAVLGALL